MTISMKTIILLIILNCSLLISLFSCSYKTNSNNVFDASISIVSDDSKNVISHANNSDTEFMALEIGSYDDADGGKHISEYACWDQDQLNYHNDNTAAESASVEFNGASYTGQYQRSSTNIPNIYTSHRYKGQNVFFDVNANTGELSSISFVYEPNERATVSEADCKEIAEKIAKQYIELDEYLVTTVKQSVYENVIYSFTYYREVDGYKTSDSLTVSVDGNGNISSFGINMLGAFAKATCFLPSQKQIQELIEAKLQQIYADLPQMKSYEIKDVVLVKLEDEKNALLYTISNNCEMENEQYSCQVQLVITLCDKD